MNELDRQREIIEAAYNRLRARLQAKEVTSAALKRAAIAALKHARLTAQGEARFWERELARLRTVK